MPADLVEGPTIPLEAGKRTPFGWPTTAISDRSITLQWRHLASNAAAIRLRITAALDVRDERLVEAFLPTTGRVLGVFDVRFANVLQPFEIDLTRCDARDIAAEGISLRSTKGEPLRVFMPASGTPSQFQPHLLIASAASPADEFFHRFESLASLQQFSWMEGCVLDGLLDLSALRGHRQARDIAREHLAMFIRDGNLICERGIGIPNDGQLYGIEAALPFAALARLDPKHPLLELPVKFWLSRRDADGAIIDGEHTSSEGAYTVGYPLAEIARARKSDELIQLALTQLRVRQQRLWNGTEFWRTTERNGRKTNRNWARGIGWQLLGTARTLSVSKQNGQPRDLIDGLRSLSEFALKHQLPSGLWSVFIDEPALAPDTAGSAGIAAALAIGAQHRWLGKDARAAARRTLDALRAHLTPDGFLAGASQANKGSEALQRSNYRVIYQTAMGLKAQLIAALA